MHDKRSEQERANDPALQLPVGKGKPAEGKMPNTNGNLSTQSNLPAVGMKTSASLRHCKSFNSKDSNKLAPKSHEINSKISSTKFSGALSSYNGSKVDVTVEQNGGKLVTKSNGNGKSEVGLAKPKQISSFKADNGQPALSRSDSKVKSPGNGSFKHSPYHVNAESQKKSSRETSPKPNITSREADSIRSAPSKVTHKSKETSPKPAFAHIKNLSLSLNADLQRKLPPIKTSRTSAKSSSAKNTANLCAECKAEVEGAVCFIGNDGRVSACTSRNAVRLCKNLKCANNNPEFVASLAAASAAPKKYLVSRRHSLPRPTVANGKSGKAFPDKMDAQAMNQNGTASPNGDLAATLPQQEGDGDYCCDFDMKGELEEDVVSLEDHSEEGAEIDGIATASPQGGRLNGHQRMKRRSFNVIETQAPAEVVTLRKQLMQERKQAEEWMLDYAIEEALQKLAPSKESKVKALVEAFESVIPQKDADVTVRDHQPEAPKTPNYKMAIRA
ncbi:hypothetical protein GOP47_0028063 [Adiantum capillus-veneris]|nr:hypothetical protein GOP47_0028063 [Adiantum capillus-veneris]